MFHSKLFWILTYFFCRFLLLSCKNAEEFSFIMRHCSAAGVLHGEARILPIMCRARRHGNTMYLYIIVPLYTDTDCFCQTVKKPLERLLRTSVGNVGGSLSIFCSSENGSRLEQIWGLMYCDFHWNDSNRDDRFFVFFLSRGKSMRSLSRIYIYSTSNSSKVWPRCKWRHAIVSSHITFHSFFDNQSWKCRQIIFLKEA